MHFDREYFRPEIREGFYIDGTMKRTWAAQIQITVDFFANVCKKYNIPWFIEWGTLLGAVRHKGFIPWDDDIDVAMLREDYIRFQSVIEDELPDGYQCISYHNEGLNNWDIMIRVVNFNTTCLNEDFVRNNCDSPFPVGVDICPLDYIPDDPAEEELYRDLCYMMGTAMGTRKRLNDPSDPTTIAIKQAIEEKIGYHFNDSESVELQVFRLSEAVYGMYGRDDKCSRVAHTWGWSRGKYGTFEKSWFDKTVMLSFENVMLPACSNPDGFLRAEYGDDYMVPVRDVYSHGYPYYKGMIRHMVSAIGYDPVYYHIDDEGIAELVRQENALDISGDKTRKALFVVPKASDWKYMEWYYNKLVQSGSGVDVMPIPFSDCDFYRNPVDENNEYESFPQDLPLIDCHNKDIVDGEYDEIVISFPYDRYNATELIDMKYFSSALRAKSRHLTYISPFETDDANALSGRDQEMMRCYVTVPGIVYADKVYVQSETMKRAYMKRLIDSYDEEIMERPELKARLSRKNLKKVFWNKIKVRE